MFTMDFCYLIISCKKNISILEVTIQSILMHSQYAYIYISFDESVSWECRNSRVIKLDYISETNVGFGNRVKGALENIKEDYVILMCDDFVVEEQVDEEELFRLVDAFKCYPQISSFALAKTSGKKNTEIFLDKYISNSRYGAYSTTLQCAFWNKNALSYLLKDAKSPWDFELFSNFRVYCSINKFYSLIEDNKQPIRYNRGQFVIRGRIVEPEKNRLEEKLGLKIDIDDFETTDSYLQISNMSIFNRIIRRLKLALYDVYFKLKSLFIAYDLNEKIF